MTAEIISAANLPAEYRAQWLRWLGEQPGLDGPCFQPDFVSGLGKFIPDCRVAVWRHAGEVACFLPFQARGRRCARSIPMCDYQAIIGRPELARDLRATLRSAGLRSWQFDNLIAAQVPTAQATRLTLTRSPRVVLAGGFDAYTEALKQAGKSGRNILTKLRLLERDHGPVSFVQGVSDEALLRRMLEWKAKRFTTSGVFPNWVEPSLQHFLKGQAAAVPGGLSVLKAGEAVVALHFGLRVGRVHYYWFPAYDEAFSKYTPGWLLVWFLLKQLHELKCDTLDFGPGGETYKEYFANAHLEFGSGLIETSASMARLHRGCAQLQQSLRQSSVAQRWIKPAVRWLRGQGGNAAATPSKA